MTRRGGKLRRPNGEEGCQVEEEEGKRWVLGKIGLGLGFFLIRVVIWIKSSGGCIRETNLFLPSHGLFINYFGFFINYFVQIRLGLGLIKFGPKFSNISC